MTEVLDESGFGSGAGIEPPTEECEHEWDTSYNTDGSLDCIQCIKCGSTQPAPSVEVSGVLARVCLQNYPLAPIGQKKKITIEIIELSGDDDGVKKLEGQWVTITIRRKEVV